MTPEQRKRAISMVMDYADKILKVTGPTDEKIRPYTEKFRSLLLAEFPDVDPFNLGWFCGTQLGAIVISIREQRREQALHATLHEALTGIHTKSPR